MDLCLSLLLVHVLIIPWLPYSSWSFFSQMNHADVQGMMGARNDGGER